MGETSSEILELPDDSDSGGDGDGDSGDVPSFSDDLFSIWRKYGLILLHLLLFLLMVVMEEGTVDLGLGISIASIWMG